MACGDAGPRHLKPIIAAVLLLAMASVAADEVATEVPIATESLPVAAVAASAIDATQALQAALERRLWSAFAEQQPQAEVTPVAPESADPPSLAERLLATTDLLRPGNRRDSRWLQARALLTADRPFTAALLLMQIEASAGDVAPDTVALLAQALYAYGTPSLAAAALGRSRGADVELQGEALLAAARWQWQEGHVIGTLAALADIPGLRVSAALKREAALLRGLAEQRRGDAAAAIKAWTEAQVDPQKLLTASPGDRLQAGIIQYNLAIALLRDGQRERGRQVLDRLGKTAASDPLNRALRDQANVTLGWHFLREAQGSTARPIFERVSLEGPLSTRALLGLGWAALAPQGERQRRKSAGVEQVDDRETPKFVLKAMQRRGVLDCHEYNRRTRAPTELCAPLPVFVQDDVPEQAALLIAKALLPWRTLRERDPWDPAVRESWTALPHALAQLHQSAEAQLLYDDALVKLDQALAVNEAAKRGLESGPLAEVLAVMVDRADPAAEAGALCPPEVLARIYQQLGIESIAAGDRFNAAILSIRRTQWLLAHSTGDLEPLLDGLLQRQLLSLNKSLGLALDEEHQRLVGYLAASRAGLASLNDRVLPLP